MRSLLLLILPLLAAAAASASLCPSDTCEIVDRNISWSELAGALSSRSVRSLTLRRVRLTDWTTGDGDFSGVESVSFEEVRAWPEAPARPLAAFRSARRLRVAGSWPFALDAASPAVTDLPSLQELELAELYVDTLNGSWIGRLKSLRSLNISACVLQALGPGTLERAAPALRRLRLADTNVTTLRDDTFGRLPNLTSLQLQGNAIYYIQPRAFAQLPQLEELSILLPNRQMAKIWEKRLAGRFANNKRLRTLRLVDARLAESQVEGAFDGLSGLRELDLRGHRFGRLHIAVLSPLVHLRRLDLSLGTISCLYNRNFGLLGQLRQLNLSHNRIHIVSALALGGLKSLTSLDLSANPLRQIQAGAFCSLAALDRPAGLLEAWGLPASVYGGSNISEACPSGLDPDKISIKEQRCPLPPPQLPHHQPGQSRYTFLIIIGLCVAFLLVTVISMMAYKGWSKRKNAEMAKDEEKELELQAMVTEQPQEPKKSQNGQSKSKRPAAASAEPNGGAVETTAQVQKAADDKSSSSSPSTSGPAATKPKVTPMTTVPEDGDIQGRDVTTLVVV